MEAEAETIAAVLMVILKVSFFFLSEGYSSFGPSMYIYIIYLGIIYFFQVNSTK